jgi:hypothetical protein
MSFIHDLVERAKGWERIRGSQIPVSVRIPYSIEFDETDPQQMGGINYHYGGGTYFLKDDKYEYKIIKKVFVPNQSDRVPRRWTYRRLL